MFPNAHLLYVSFLVRTVKVPHERGNQFLWAYLPDILSERPLLHVVLARGRLLCIVPAPGSQRRSHVRSVGTARDEDGAVADGEEEDGEPNPSSPTTPGALSSLPSAHRTLLTTFLLARGLPSLIPCSRGPVQAISRGDDSRPRVQLACAVAVVAPPPTASNPSEMHEQQSTLLTWSHSGRVSASASNATVAPARTQRRPSTSPGPSTAPATKASLRHPCLSRLLRLRTRISSRIPFITLTSTQRLLVQILVLEVRRGRRRGCLRCGRQGVPLRTRSGSQWRMESVNAPGTGRGTPQSWGLRQMQGEDWGCNRWRRCRRRRRQRESAVLGHLVLDLCLGHHCRRDAFINDISRI
ncbi:hypothetical protein L226DRAFT_369965 [Lentinus tigrinus ALCF2SS1-7]|uniref:uncharacterized protein n=1 Tax=Lentinus tigrinus ALCF2SS1-7 TaxID=1328758 RepID=UPI001165F0E4|nr:hypothetical protein L226DRAFT_401588 [Lentinus tigrinus ALCF2SS1-7]RPD68008.1 hypothetical protein L226DRAFT_369965 [Lentinus tigrinus ALCF2SS1-7]